MKKTILSLAMLGLSATVFAGGILTNTNQSVAFIRMMTRGAMIDSDGPYSNPAGLGFLQRDGLHLSFNWQNAYQERNIDATFPLFPEANNHRFYKGTASAPIIPSLFLTYKNGPWAISAYGGVIGGGGEASYSKGLPMFDSMVMAGIAANPAVQSVMKVTGAQAASDLYDLNTSMKGRQFIYAFQAGVTYRVADWLSIYAGARMNYFVGGYKGYVTATAKPELLQNPVIQAAAAANSQLAAMANQPLVDLRLDVDQKGWGLAPIIGAHIKLNKWNIGLKYELKANLNIENETKENSDPNGALAAYSDGVNTPSDVPALFSGAVMYEILPTLRASVEYHHFFDKNAEMANDKQRALTRGTNEYQVGVEWDAHKYFSLSAGYQRTDYGLSDEFQYDTSFYCDSYSVGLGGVIHLSQRMKVNVGYFWTHYRKYTKQSPNYNGTTLPGTNVYSRHNKVFGASIDYIF